MDNKKILDVHIEEFSYGLELLLNNIVFSVKAGEHVSILGESGSGKTTILHLIYGLLTLNKGTILYKDEKVLGPKERLIPGAPYMKLVSQESDLMPYATVSENIATNIPAENYTEIPERLNQLLKLIELEHFKESKVKTLSGGQKQRVALAKALVMKPKILLLDEAFSNIDSVRKNNLRRTLFDYLKENNIACISATHDSEEALAFSDKIIIIHKGTTAIEGTPEFVYNTAKPKEIAGFFGEYTVFPSSTSISKEYPAIVYPHQLQVGAKNLGVLTVTVKANYFKGSHYLIEGIWENQSVFFHHSQKLDINSKQYLQYINKK